MEPPDSPRLLVRVREKIRLKHYSIRTEQAYVDWIKRFIVFHGKRHPATLGAPEVEAFLTDLAVARRVAAATQNQAKSALLFLYKDVLDIELPWLGRVESAKGPQRLPVILTQAEVAEVLRNFHGVHALIGRLLYGTGMRVMEGMRLRVKDVDFARGEIVVRDGKGRKDRVTVLPRSIESQLRRQLVFARALHEKDLKTGCGETWLPFALARKYRAAAHEWAWQYVFPAPERSRDPRSGAMRRHHLSDQSFQRDAPGGARRAHREACDAAYAAALVRDASARVGLRHPHRAGAARPRGRRHDDDLHARPQSRRARGRESA
jgi:integron integrase